MSMVEAQALAKCCIARKQQHWRRAGIMAKPTLRQSVGLWGLCLILSLLCLWAAIQCIIPCMGQSVPIALIVAVASVLLFGLGLYLLKERRDRRVPGKDSELLRGIDYSACIKWWANEERDVSSLISDLKVCAARKRNRRVFVVKTISRATAVALGVSGIVGNALSVIEISESIGWDIGAVYFIMVVELYMASELLIALTPEQQSAVEECVDDLEIMLRGAQ